jgi:hypothetical protein
MPARRARRPCAPLQPARLRGLRNQLRLRGDGRPARRDPRRHPGHDQPKPMDRLVCGDVGFGKTEVALRAAFVAVTAASRWRSWRRPRCWPSSTYQTLVDRFGKWPVKIAELSRFRSPKEVKAALEGIADGTVDIVVGTHKLLSSRRQVQAPGPAGDRRGAPLRRAPQGGDEGAARRGRRADAHRHADPAHAGHGAGRPARSQRHRHRAAAAAGHQDLRAQRGHRRHPRGGAARAQARRAGLLPAQRGGDDREPRAEARRAAARGAHRVAHGQMPERQLER